VSLDHTITPTTRILGRDRMSSATTTVSKTDLLSRPSYPTRVITTTLEYPKASGRKRARRSSCDEIRRTPAVSRRLSEGGVVPMSMSPKAVGGRPPRQVRNGVGGHEGADDFAMEWYAR
ncbi:hypothetical protein FOZ63_010655, partial [Perkinsus olseni]